MVCSLSYSTFDCGGKRCGVTTTFAVRIAVANPRKLAEKFRKHFKNDG